MMCDFRLATPTLFLLFCIFVRKTDLQRSFPPLLDGFKFLPVVQLLTFVLWSLAFELDVNACFA